MRHALVIAAFCLLGASQALAQTCSVTDWDCPPEPCSMGDPRCPEGLICIRAPDNAVCNPPSADCRLGGFCAAISQTRCSAHTDCPEREICFDKGRPLCKDGDDPDGPPCETPTSQPQGQCGPPTECTEDAHCTQGFACDTYQLSMGVYRTEIGVCTPQKMACQTATDCPQDWRCDADAEGGLCLPPEHTAACTTDACYLIRDRPPAALSSPHASQAPVQARPAVERPIETEPAGCQTAPGTSGGISWVLVMMGIVGWRRRATAEG